VRAIGRCSQAIVLRLLKPLGILVLTACQSATSSFSAGDTHLMMIWCVPIFRYVCVSLLYEDTFISSSTLVCSSISTLFITFIVIWLFFWCQYDYMIECSPSIDLMIEYISCNFDISLFILKARWGAHILNVNTLLNKLIATSLQKFTFLQYDCGPCTLQIHVKRCFFLVSTAGCANCSTL